MTSLVNISPNNFMLICEVLCVVSISNGCLSVIVPGDQWYRPVNWNKSFVGMSEAQLTVIVTVTSVDHNALKQMINVQIALT